MANREEYYGRGRRSSYEGREGNRGREGSSQHRERWGSEEENRWGGQEDWGADPSFGRYPYGEEYGPGEPASGRGYTERGGYGGQHRGEPYGYEQEGGRGYGGLGSSSEGWGERFDEPSRATTRSQGQGRWGRGREYGRQSYSSGQQYGRPYEQGGMGRSSQQYGGSEYGGQYGESQYRGGQGSYGSQYGGSQYGGSQYGGSQYGTSGRRYEGQSFGTQQHTGFEQGGSTGTYGYDTWNRGEETRGKHWGRGPKGYRRSDERLREEISDRLMWDPEIDASDIEVRVSQGVVTLSGVVEDRSAKRMAEDIAEEVLGVEDVQNELKVRRGFLAGLTGEKATEDDNARAQSRQTTGSQTSGTTDTSRRSGKTSTTGTSTESPAL